jgi:flagellar assembly protein FliH
MASLGREHSSAVLLNVKPEDLRETLFSRALPGSGDVKPLALAQTAPAAGTAELDPRSLALLVRPERYQERLARQQSDLESQEGTLKIKAEQLEQLDAQLAQREIELDAREVELETLVLSAVEQRVEELAEQRLGEDRMRLASSITQLEAVAHGLLDQARLDLLELAVKIAAKVIGAELQARPQALVGLIRSALEAAAPNGQVTLQLHPKDHAMLSKRGPQVLGRLPANITIQLAANEEVDRGGVIIASAAGRVDATIAKRLQRVGAQLTELAEG